MLPALRLPGRRWPTGVAAARVALTAVALVLVASGLPHAQTDSKPAADPLAGSSPHPKFNRQLDLFERVIDDLLIDSENALTTHDRNALGVYLPGQGAVFAFTFSLVGQSWAQTLAMGDGHFRFLHRLDDRDLRVFDLDNDDDDDDDEDDGDKDKQEKNGDEKRRRRTRIEHRGRGGDWAELDEGELKKLRTRQYGETKQEIITMLGEYGDLLEGLPADEWVTLVARPRDVSWGERKVKRLVIRARIRDLIDRAEERIDEGSFRDRLMIEEYR